MIEDELEVKVIKIVKEPRISLTMISRYVVATEKAKTRIIKGCKYPPEYIPRYHEMARKLVPSVRRVKRQRLYGFNNEQESPTPDKEINFLIPPPSL